MKPFAKFIVIIALLAAVLTVLALKQDNSQSSPCCPNSTATETACNTETQAEQTTTCSTECQSTASEETTEEIGPLPRLLELGSHGCVPCQQMMPILEQLTAEYENKLQVDFIDVRQNRQAASQYNIRIIPTQIFFDASGNELFRHEGFFAKQDILETFERFNINLN